MPNLHTPVANGHSLVPDHARGPPCQSQAANFSSTVDDALNILRLLLKNAEFAMEDVNRSSSVSSVCNQEMVSKVEEITSVANELKRCVRRVVDVKATNQETTPKQKSFESLEPTAQDFANELVGVASSQPSVWSGFYNKTLRERFDVLTLMYPRLARLKGNEADKEKPLLTSEPAAEHPLGKLGELPMRTANLMIENCIGVIGIPLGLGLNFIIDGKHLSVPMAVEEPSVIAAASSAAKLVASFGEGFRTATSGNIMTSQIQLVDTPDIAAAVQAIEDHREYLLNIANTHYCPNMKKRGGGAIDIYCRIVSQAARTQSTHRISDSYWYTPAKGELDINASDANAKYLVVHIDVDVCEAMGANIVNTVAEGLSDEVCRLTLSRSGLRILTNLCVQRRARSIFEIPVKKLGWKGVDGEQVAQRIVEAYNFAAIDPYRAVTNNKGIMNGIDAVAIATGQDWRAIESAAHCYASRSGQYASLSRYEITTDADGTRVLRGSLEFPIAVGSKGGALGTHPGYKATHAILNHPTARNLSGIIMSVGLAQNFAAIRAIAVTGIQKGHMALHARNIAVAAGAPSELVAELCSYMLGRKCINLETAKEYLDAHQLFSEIQNNSPPTSPSPVTLPSMFYVELPVPHMEGTISINIAFESINKHPQYIAIMAPSSNNKVDQTRTNLQQQLLGDKGYNQLEKMFMLLASMRSIVITGTDEANLLVRTNIALQNKLQLLSVLVNIISYRLMETRSPIVLNFMDKILQYHDMRELDAKRCHAILSELPASDEILSTGLPLFLALGQVLHYHIEQEVHHPALQERLIQEQWHLLRCIVQSYKLQENTSTVTSSSAPTDASNSEEAFMAFMAVQTKRWQATMLLLIDALTLAPEQITPARLDFLTQIGDYMQWEGTIAHDLARFKRAVTEGEPNAFLFWLQQRRLDAVSKGDEYVEEFRRVADTIAASKWQALMQQHNADSDVFSMPAVATVVQIIRSTYQDRRRARSRNDSF